MTDAFADPVVIDGYHAHLYYASPTRPIAERLRAGIAERFPQARIGSWHDERRSASCRDVSGRLRDR